MPVLFPLPGWTTRPAGLSTTNSRTVLEGHGSKCFVLDPRRRRGSRGRPRASQTISPFPEHVARVAGRHRTRGRPRCRRWTRAWCPQAPARKALRPPAWSRVETTAPSVPGALDHVEQRQHAEGDRHVGEVERRPERQLDEVGHRAVAEAVGDVAERAAHEHSGGQPDQRPGGMAREVGQKGQEGDADQDRHADVASGQEAERDPAVARVHELNPRKQPVFLTPDDRVFRRPGQLVGRDHDGQNEPGADPGGRPPRAGRGARPSMTGRIGGLSRG